jgi:glycosyltransferase involved in cell wall biosynthesis
MAELVTVVMPTLNYAPFIARAIESALTQRYAPVECIVVDNGSTDATLDILARYRGRVRVLNQPTPGPSAARNLGLQSASGQYIAFLDADDRWHPDKLRRQVALLESIPQVGAVGCGVEYVSADGKLVDVRDFPESSIPTGDLAAQLRGVAVRAFGIGGSASGAVVRRDVLDAVGPWDESLPSAEDWDLWMRIAARHEIRNVSQRLVQITRHAAGTWRDPAMRESNQWRACNAALARWPDVLAPVANRMRALLLSDVGGEYAAIGEHRQALEKYLASLRHWPYDGSRWRAVVRLVVKRLTRR